MKGININKDSLLFLNNIRIKTDRKINMLKEKIKIGDILQKNKISYYKIEELSHVSPKNQRYWKKQMIK